MMEFGMAKMSKHDWVRFGCSAAAVLLAALALARLAGFLTGPARAASRAAGMVGEGDRDPNDLKQAVDAAKGVADALKKKNLFAKEPPKEHPIKQVDGILGSEAFIQNKWYKAGDKVADAKIVSVGATGVVVEWQGSKKTFSPMSAGGPPESGPPSPPEPPAVAKAPEPNKPAKKVDANEVKVATAPPTTDDPFAFMGVTLPAKVREKLLEKWSSMTDEQKEQAKQEWNQMPEEQKQQAMKMLENMNM